MRFAIALVLMLASCCSAAEDFFPLGLWYEGGVGEARDNVLPADPARAALIYDKNFADIAAHGINLIVVPNSPPEHHKLVLDAAHEHHLKVILELGLDGGPIGYMIRGQSPMDDSAVARELEKTLRPSKDHPALLRVQLLDEPPADAFNRYSDIAKAVHKFEPKIEPFCCLTGASDGGAFLDASKSNVVAFDMYPFGVNDKKSLKPLQDFLICADRFADCANQRKAASWAVLQCHEITRALRYPTAAELRCMTWLSLASGSKGLFWFLYQSEHFTKDAMMNGLVDRDFKPRPLWDEVAKLTKELSPLTQTLSKLQPCEQIPQNDPTFLARAFVDDQRNDYIIAVNLNTLAPEDVQIFGQPVHLDPGGGALVRLK
jgi:hypothetical protein